MSSPKLWHKILLLSISVLFGTAGVEATESVDEDVLKVAYIFNFVKFTQWPKSAFEDSESKLNLCTIGDNPLSGELKDLENNSVKNRIISVIHLDKGGEDEVLSQGCHLLFIEGEAGELTALPGKLTGSPLLIVSERDGFVTNGGVINLKIVDKKIRFEVNLESANKNKITISSHLLKLALKVYGA